MGTIEDALRATFAAEVSRSPALEGAADRAMARARRTRRTHAGLSAAAAVVAVILAGGATVTLHERLNGTPVGPAGPALAYSPSAAALSMTVPVDLVVGDNIRTTDGRWIPFVEATSVEAAYRIEDDWLVQARDLGATDRSLWSVRADGTTKRLVTAIAFAVSPDGRQVAWATGDFLRVAELVDRRLVNERETRGRGELVPYGFAGEAVLLTAQAFGAEPTSSPSGEAEPPRIPQAGQTEPFDLWFPSRGSFVPGPKPSNPVFGMGLSPSGARLLGMAAVGPETPEGREFCLAELDFGTLEPTRSVCGLSIAPTAGLSYAPDGHRALVTGGSYLQLVDLNAVFDTAVITEVSTAAFDVVAWADGDTAVVSNGVDVYVIPVSRAGGAQVVSWRNAGSGEVVRVIPRLR